MAKEARIFSLVQELGQCIVVVEEVDGPHLVPIWIGIFEGSAIAAQLIGEKFPRPMTHDLMMNIIKDMGATIDRVTITDLKDNSYYAEIAVKQNGKAWVIDSRPSDAMALAVRAQCPIFIEERVLEKCPEMLKPITKDEAEKLKKELQNMTPEDFFRGLKDKDNRKQTPPSSDEEDQDKDQ